MKHTPGPWHAVQYANYWSLQKDYYYSDTDSLLDEEKCPDAEANAELCAAAPDLLEALKESLQFVKKYANDHESKIAFRMVDKMNAAIKKATD